MKKNHIKKEGYQGATFGIMEGIVMMLGVLIGLSVTGNKSIAILGVVTAGVADAFANSSAFHVSEESEGIHTRKEIWKSTFWSFAGTAGSVIVMIIPLLIFNVPLAAYVGFAVAIVLLALLAVFVAKYQKMDVTKLIIKYIVIGVSVSVATFIVSELLLRVLVI
ncbi:hypothetical protein KY337_05050 [Candidatus Woesearchaeota archaeon]|nr:hypothetical protein [Candidatus Woesearchaeota archaeon]